MDRSAVMANHRQDVRVGETIERPRLLIEVPMLRAGVRDTEPAALPRKVRIKRLEGKDDGTHRVARGDLEHRLDTPASARVRELTPGCEEILDLRDACRRRRIEADGLALRKQEAQQGIRGGVEIDHGLGAQEVDEMLTDHEKLEAIRGQPETGVGTFRAVNFRGYGLDEVTDQPEGKRPAPS